MKKYIYTSLLFLTIGLFYSSCGDSSNKNDIKNNRNKFESGRSDNPRDFFSGVVAEYVSVQSKGVFLIECLDGSESCESKANEVITRGKSSLDALKSSSNVGVSASSFKVATIAYIEAWILFAEDVINNSYDENSFEDLLITEEDYITAQSLYAEKNDIIISGTYDPYEDYE